MKLGTLADDLGDDLDGLSDAFLKQFEVSSDVYSVLLMLAILAGLLIFIFTAPFEFASMRRQVLHLHLDLLWPTCIAASPAPYPIGCIPNVDSIILPISLL